MSLRVQLALALTLCALASLAAGCGGLGTRRYGGTPGPMPSGESFTGVWHSPQYGDMQMVQTGDAVIAEYVRDERRGRIQGTASGDLLRFEWNERREMVAGRPVTTRGHGYFRFQIGDDGDAYLVGEWGHDANEVGGGPWRAARDRRRRPTLGSSGGSGGDSGASGDSSGGGGDAFPSSGGSSGGDAFPDSSGSGGSSGSGSSSGLRGL